MSYLGSQPNDFVRLDGNPGQPDFSASGSLIEFGYLTSIRVTIPSMDNDMGVDNFRTFIDYVAPVPEPATWLLCLLLLGWCVSFPLYQCRGYERKGGS